MRLLTSTFAAALAAAGAVFLAPADAEAAELTPAVAYSGDGGGLIHGDYVDGAALHTEIRHRSRGYYGGRKFHGSRGYYGGRGFHRSRGFRHRGYYGGSRFYHGRSGFYNRGYYGRGKFRGSGRFGKGKFHHGRGGKFKYY